MRSAAARAVVLAALAVLLGACRFDATDARVQVRSWEATARMVAEAWSAGEVPKPFATRALDAAAKELARAEKVLSRDDAVEAARAARAVHELARALESDDRARIDRALHGVGR